MKTTNRLKILTFIIASTLILYSCNLKDEQNNIIEKEYLFKNIEFQYNQSSEKRIYDQNLHAIIYFNGTSITQTILYNPLEGIVETSQFKDKDGKAFDYLSDSIFVYVPFDFDQNNNVTLGDYKWLISPEIERRKPNYSISSSISIAPNTEVTLNTKLTFKKISTKYIITLEGKRTLEEKVFEGIWTGVYLIKAEPSIVWTDI